MEELLSDTKVDSKEVDEVSSFSEDKENNSKKRKYVDDDDEKRGILKFLIQGNTLKFKKQRALQLKKLEINSLYKFLSLREKNNSFTSNYLNKMMMTSYYPTLTRIRVNPLLSEKRGSRIAIVQNMRFDNRGYLALGMSNGEFIIHDFDDVFAKSSNFLINNLNVEEAEEVEAWQPINVTPFFSVKTNSKSIEALSWDINNKNRIACGGSINSSGNDVFLINLEDESIISFPNNKSRNQGQYTDIVFTPQGSNEIIAGDDKGYMYLWDVRRPNQTPIWSFYVHDSNNGQNNNLYRGINSLLFASSNLNTIVCGTNNGDVMGFDWRNVRDIPAFCSKPVPKSVFKWNSIKLGNLIPANRRVMCMKQLPSDDDSIVFALSCGFTGILSLNGTVMKFVKDNESDDTTGEWKYDGTKSKIMPQVDCLRNWPINAMTLPFPKGRHCLDFIGRNQIATTHGVGIEIQDYSFSYLNENLNGIPSPRCSQINLSSAPSMLAVHPSLSNIAVYNQNLNSLSVYETREMNKKKK